MTRHDVFVGSAMLYPIMRWQSLHTFAALLAGLMTLTTPSASHAAVGCALANPEEDLKVFFPHLTDFSTHYLTFQAQAPERLPLLSEGIGDALDPVYETADVPYTLYSVRKRGERLGYVFGANQRGTYSNIQVIAVTDEALDLQHVYLQKIRSPKWEAFRSEAFSDALASKELSAYPKLRSCYVEGRCEGVGVEDPSGGEESGDFRSILRALAKLHMLSELLLEPGVERAGKTDQARSERVSSWWHDEPFGRAIQSPRWSTVTEAPWPEQEPVLVWRGTQGGVIVPLAVLGTHPVVNAEIGGRSVAFTWSAYADTAVVLERPERVHFEPTLEVLHGVTLVTASDDRGQWSPALGMAIRGVSVGRTSELAAGPVKTTYARARRVAPQARVLLGEERDDVENLLAVRGRLSQRGEIGQGRKRVTVVAIGDQRHGFELAKAEDGLYRARMAGRDVALVHAGELRAAFIEPEANALVYVGMEPFGGAPWLWNSITESLHEGISGGVLLGPDSAVPLEPVALYSMPERSFGALHSGAKLTRVSAR
jgi:hypothetical protein